MAKKPIVIIDNVELGKLVHGGQCIAQTPEGKKIFVWGGLPDEIVDVRIVKKKSKYLEGIVQNIIRPSDKRIEIKEPKSYLSTSPWQMMDFKLENTSKQSILEESFKQERVEDISWQPFLAPEELYSYRNKMEFGFWGDDDGIHLAHFVRGTHGKQIVEGSVLARDEINQAAKDICSWLSSHDSLRAGDLKTVVIRSSQVGEVVAALYVKSEDIEWITETIPESLKALVICYSNPLSPASIRTHDIYTHGDILLNDDVCGHNLIYDVFSFFQVNIAVFALALDIMRLQLSEIDCVDFYCGVGSIGVPLGAKVLVDSDKASIEMAHLNARMKAEVVHAQSEKALSYIDSEKVLIVDPPRAGLHRDVTDEILAKKPPRVLYLSCNPSTQARDVALLLQYYKITYAQGFNFFPRTPHIENLIVLELK